MFTIRPTDFETVLPFWRDKIWPGRQSPIRPVSTMLYLGGFDVSIHDRYKNDVRFFAAYWDGVGSYDRDHMIGVTSGHPTSKQHFRHRTFYVEPAFQRLGIGAALMAAVEQAGADAGCELIWGLPRNYMVPFFLSRGWIQASGEITEGVEFGPNVYVSKMLRHYQA